MRPSRAVARVRDAKRRPGVESDDAVSPSLDLEPELEVLDARQGAGTELAIRLSGSDHHLVGKQQALCVLDAWTVVAAAKCRKVDRLGG